TRPSWTPELTNTIHNLRAAFAAFQTPIAPILPAAERARIPKEGVPEGVLLSSIIVPPTSSLPPSILDDHIVPVEVPLFFYSTEPLSSLSPATSKAVLYIHGGANVLGHPADAENVKYVGALVKQLGTGCVVAAPDYRCATAPEATFPANMQDVWTTYVHLLESGYAPENITIAGDSSGGNVAIVLTYLISQAPASLPMPGRIVAFAPASDLTYNLSDHARAQVEVDLFSVESYKECTTHYLHDPASPFGPLTVGWKRWRPDDPLVSAVFIPKFREGWPRTLILVGSADQLVDASRVLERRMREDDVCVELVEYVDAVHGFWAFPFFDECR
ncbi:alpha/beta-hydrolase, partial [Dentipellis sp. KUC8613]